MHAHGVDTEGGKCQRPSEGSRPPEHAVSTDINPVPPGWPGAIRWRCHCSLRAVHCSPFKLDRHRCTPATQCIAMQQKRQRPGYSRTPPSSLQKQKLVFIPLNAFFVQRDVAPYRPKASSIARRPSHAINHDFLWTRRGRAQPR